MPDKPEWYSNPNPVMKVQIKKEKIKKVFVLEDDEERIAWFKEKFSFADLLFITKDVRVALSYLQDKFDLIFLDHDLEFISIYDESKPDYNAKATGYDVAIELRNTINRETECIIHSVNPTGAANMVKAHPFNTAHVPFTMLRENLEIV